MTAGEITFKQYAHDLRRAYWLRLIEQQAAGTQIPVKQPAAAVADQATQNQIAEK